MTTPKSKLCPICKKPAEEASFPFCSKRCAMLDLGRWLKGEYVIPGDETSTDALPEYVPDAGETVDEDRVVH